MGAKEVVLTHFSQRYSKVAWLNFGGTALTRWQMAVLPEGIDPSKVTFAFDLMRVGL